MAAAILASVSGSHEQKAMAIFVKQELVNAVQAIFAKAKPIKFQRVHRPICVALMISLAIGICSRPAWSDEKNTHVFIDNERTLDEPHTKLAADVLSLFKSRCWECHGGDSQEGGLRLDRIDAALRGGDSGAAVVPGKSAESRLFRYVAGLDPDTVMPPEGPPLNKTEIALIREWIDQGTPWPKQNAETEAGAASSHWAFRPIVRPNVPSSRGSGFRLNNDVDNFIAERLRGEGLDMSPEADRATLIRRLSLDLVGLPPSPENVIEFVSDSRPDAYEHLVDRLLASPHFGERWALDWLDLARYADSNGFDNDEPRLHAWRYRQWVIEAINRDLPLDKFAIEQLAGDLLPAEAPGSQTERLVATGFQRNTPLNTESGIDKEEFRVSTAVARVNTLGTVWLGLTIGCAQCHAHKYDPISQRDYYGLLAFYNSIREIEIDAPLEDGLEASMAEGDKSSPKALAMAEAETIRPSHVMLRGDYRRPGVAVEPRTPEILPLLTARGRRPDRLDLARWLFEPKHPLTARVTANRIWLQLFGQGLVRTVEDFGTQGEPPTHPELLDYLASELIRNGWSRKQLIKMIVLSTAYRQSSWTSPKLMERDPENLRLARQNRWRPEGEIVRDLALAASGLLQGDFRGPSVRLQMPADETRLLMKARVAGKHVGWTPSGPPDCYCRSIYVWVQRAVPLPMMNTFDAPDRHVTCARRYLSNTSLQALTMLNESQFVDCARALGLRLLREGKADDERISRGFLLCLGREPDTYERQRICQLVDEQRKLYADESARPTEVLNGQPLPQGVSNAESAAWVAVARVLLNLDEFMTRE